MKTLLVFCNNIEIKNKQNESLAEFLQKVLSQMNEIDRTEIDEYNEQLFCDCLFSGAPYEPKPVSIRKLRLKNDKKMRQLVDTLRKGFN